MVIDSIRYVTDNRISGSVDRLSDTGASAPFTGRRADDTRANCSQTARFNPGSSPRPNSAVIVPPE